jgi:hypothetical protein
MLPIDFKKQKKNKKTKKKWRDDCMPENECYFNNRVHFLLKDSR